MIRKVWKEFNFGRFKYLDKAVDFKSTKKTNFQNKSDQRFVFEFFLKLLIVSYDQSKIRYKR